MKFLTGEAKENIVQDSVWVRRVGHTKQAKNKEQLVIVDGMQKQRKTPRSEHTIKCGEKNIKKREELKV